MNKPTLVIIAAGMGSRYGGLKQLDGFGPSGETIMDYTVYDAIRAGFGKIIFVIRKDFEGDFNKKFIDKIAPHANVDYVFQELDKLPEGYAVPGDRIKPWGTGHALWVTREVVDTPFAVVNADDFYGQSSLHLIHDHLAQLDSESLQAVMVGYILKNTLSDHGKVSRGICSVYGNGVLESIIERTDIYKKHPEGAYYVENEAQFPLTGNETVSMNLMGFTPKVYPMITEGLTKFLDENAAELKAEFYLPKILDMVRQSGVDVPVLETHEKWFGVTYQDDKPLVKDMLDAATKKGTYPVSLWS